MCAQLAVDCGAPHAQKDTHLAEERSVVVRIAVAVCTEKPTFQLAHPERLQVSDVLNGGRAGGTNLGTGPRSRRSGHFQEPCGSAQPELSHCATAGAC